MKVCIVVNNEIWFDPRVNKQIKSYLSDGGIELCAVGADYGGMSREKIEEYGFPITLIEIPQKYRGKLKTVAGKLLRERYLIRAMEKAIVGYNPDVIHSNDLDAYRPALRAAKKLKRRVIYDSHEVFTENNNLVNKPLYKKYLKAIERKIVKKCDKMVCVSNSAADYFASEYKIERPTVITNCVSKSSVLTSPAPKNGFFEVLNHGQYYEKRGYDIMARACDLFGKYPDIRLAVRGYGRIEDDLRKTVSQASDREKFIFYPPVTVDELIPSAAKASVGVAVTEPYCLNFKLSVSNKLFEYAAAGLPVILSDIPEHRILNEKYHFGIIIDKNTPECFAEAVILLYENRDLYKELSDNALKMSRELNWDGEFSELIRFEKEIVNAEKNN